MSATNRGGIRAANDFYETPMWLTEAIVPFLPARPTTILEPACGSGAIVRVLRRAFPDSEITAFDIDARHTGRGVDFLASPPVPKYDLIITNPPYALAQEFVAQALKWRRDADAVVAMLLRLNFLGGQDRARFMRERLPAVYISPRRPSFTGNGTTDATEYSWMFFGDSVPHGTWRLLETEVADTRTGELFGQTRQLRRR